MDRDTVKKEVARSIVRICFDWDEDKNKKFMVIAGVIISINADGSAVIVANSTLFKKKLKFVVNFPNVTGYEEQALSVSNDLVNDGVDFCTFSLKPSEEGYIKPIRFETQPVKQGDEINAFVFPREGFITPVAYCRGSITYASAGVVFLSCPMHSYGYLGSPIFNLRGDLVGITYLDRGHLHAWTVQHLLSDVFGTRAVLLFPMEYHKWEKLRRP